MSAPTLWEEGRMSGSRVARLAGLAGVLVLAADLAINRHPSVLFDICFVLVCVGSALAVRPRDFFVVGVLPPLLLLGLIAAVALAQPDWVAQSSDGPVQAVVSGLAHRASGLLTAYLLTLAVLGIRQQVRNKHRRIVQERADQAWLAAAPTPQAKRDGSPAPTRSTTGVPSEKSTTVVGSAPHSPESMTASNQ